jgi:hypothetical protein
LHKATAAGYISNSANAREIRFYRNLMVHLEQCRQWEQQIAAYDAEIQLARGPKKDVLKSRLKAKQTELAKRVEAIHAWHTTMKTKHAASAQKTGENPNKSLNILCLEHCSHRPFVVDLDAKVNEMLIPPHTHERSTPWALDRVTEMIAEIFLEKLRRDVIMKSINSPLEHLIAVMHRLFRKKFVTDSAAGIKFHEQGFVWGVLQCIQVFKHSANTSTNFAAEMGTGGVHRAFLFASLIGIAGEGEGREGCAEGEGRPQLGLHPTTSELFFDRLLRPCVLAGTLGWPLTAGNGAAQLPEDDTVVLSWLRGGDAGITTVPTRAVVRAVEESNRDVSHYWTEEVEMAKQAKTGVGPGTTRRVFVNTNTKQRQYTIPDEMRIARAFPQGVNKFSGWLLPPELQRLKKAAWEHAVQVEDSEGADMGEEQQQQEKEKEEQQIAEPAEKQRKQPAVAQKPPTVAGNRSNMDWLLLEVLLKWVEKARRHTLRGRTASSETVSSKSGRGGQSFFRDQYRAQVATAWRQQLLEGSAMVGGGGSEGADYDSDGESGGEEWGEERGQKGQEPIVHRAGWYDAAAHGRRRGAELELLQAQSSGTESGVGDEGGGKDREGDEDEEDDEEFDEEDDEEDQEEDVSEDEDEGREGEKWAADAEEERPEVCEHESEDGEMVEVEKAKVRFASSTSAAPVDNNARSNGASGIGRWKHVLNSQAASMPSFAEFMHGKQETTDNLELLMKRGETISSPLAQSIAMMRGALMKGKDEGTAAGRKKEEDLEGQQQQEEEAPVLSPKSSTKGRGEAQQRLIAEQQSSGSAGVGVPLASSEDIMGHFFHQRAARVDLLRKTNGFENRAQLREATRKAVKGVLGRDEFSVDDRDEDEADPDSVLTMDQLLQSLRSQSAADAEARGGELDNEGGGMLAGRRGRMGKSSSVSGGGGDSRPRLVPESRPSTSLHLSKQNFIASQQKLHQRGPVPQGRMNIAQRTALEEHRQNQVRLGRMERQVAAEEEEHGRRMDDWDLRRGEMTRKKKRALLHKGEQWRRQATVAEKLVARSKEKQNSRGKSRPQSAPGGRRYGGAVRIEEVWNTTARIKALEDGMRSGTLDSDAATSVLAGLNGSKAQDGNQQLQEGTGEPRLDAVLENLGAPTHRFTRAFLRL